MSNIDYIKTLESHVEQLIQEKASQEREILWLRNRGTHVYTTSTRLTRCQENVHDEFQPFSTDFTKKHCLGNINNIMNCDNFDVIRAVCYAIYPHNNHVAEIWTMNFERKNATSWTLIDIIFRADSKTNRIQTMNKVFHCTVTPYPNVR